MNNIQRTNGTNTNNNNTNNSKNKSMEVIGDVLLNMVITLELAERFPWASSGELTCRRAHLVSRDTCAHVAHRLGLGTTTIKAMIGTLFTDSGKSHEVVHAWIVRHWSSHLSLCVEETAEVDAKTRLQECTQRAGFGLPTYVVETGAGAGQHGASVCVSVSVASHKCTGEGTTKKLAEKEAATKMLCMLKEARGAMMSTARRVRGGGIVFPGTALGVASDLKHMFRRWCAFHTTSQCIRISALHASPTSQILSS